MTREQKIRYAAESSHHSIDSIRRIADRNEENLDLMVKVADGLAEQNLRERAMSMS
ncbi:hypothetical protein [Lactobacillus acetotolerans]|uniref:hypothetical protein n=1 Tax=Lactobacillus acetotolerans TaxID=1600 RepID=UPI002FD9923B